MNTLKGAQQETIAILGCGWYGFALAQKLVESGFLVKGSTTSENKLALLKEANIAPYLVNFELENTAFDESFFDCDILVVSIPPKRSSPNLKDFPAKIKAIVTAAEKKAVKQLIFISSTGVYQDGNFRVDETVIPEPDTDSGKAMFAAEQLLNETTSLTTTIIRFAGLIGPNRNLAKHFAGRMAIPNGLAPINLIHLDDCLGITLSIITQKAFGNTYHAVVPDHPTRAAFYTSACQTSGLAQPEFVDELLSWKQIDSSNVPTILGYQFKINNWDNWLANRA